MIQAFILGAGLGTRLRPLTDQLPKPLVPLFHRPLASWTIEACRRVGIHRFAINTHHLPEAWSAFPHRPELAGSDLTFFHEPLLLETGGGLKNIQAWTHGRPLLVHNGDIFSTLPLDRLIDTHLASGLPATLAVVTSGAEKRVALDPSSNRVIDVRNELGRARGTHVFTGIYCVNPPVFDLIPPAAKIPIIPAFLRLAADGLLGAVVLDEGTWLDLGDRGSYLDAHRTLNLAPPIHPDAVVEEGATIHESVIGPGAVVRSGAQIRHSVIWPGAVVDRGAILEDCIVRSGQTATGTMKGADV